MSYCIEKNSARYTLQGAVAMLELLGVHVNFDSEIIYQGSKRSGLTWLFGGRKYRYEVTIDSNMSIENQKLTLSHEMAHIILGHLIGNKIDSDYNISLEQQEFEAEALGLMICNFLFGLNGINNAK